MKIKLYEIPIKKIYEGYKDNGEFGVVGYGGRLDIRPKFQREFIYDTKKRNAVIDTIRKNFPLNVMYWAMTSGTDFDDPNATFEVLDGQQRTISFCQYLDGEFSVDFVGFDNLTPDKQKEIEDYKVMVYFCDGTDSEKLDWFKIINIAGEQLTNQELRNAVYTGPWLSSAKSIFSKSNCPAYNLAKDYVNGSPLRQELLETAISWINNGKIEEYMSQHQHDPNANELWTYFKNVIDWVKLTIPHYRKEQKGINWAKIYDANHSKIFNVTDLENRIEELYMDDEVDNKKGIYEYIFDGLEKHLNLRSFTPSQRQKAYNKQGGLCPRCAAMHKPTAGKVWAIDEMEADHIKPWHKGGKTEDSNCQMLCIECNREKGGH